LRNSDSATLRKTDKILRRRNMTGKKSFFTIFSALLLGFVFSLAPAMSAVPSAGYIMERMKNLNPDLRDYQVKLKISLKAQYSILKIRPEFEGTYYFKQPDKHKLIVNKLPNLLRKYPQVFGWHLPKIENFNTVVTEGSFEGTHVYILEMTPKFGMGDLLKIELWVDKQKYTFPKQVYIYKDDGRIELLVNYRKEGKWTLFDKMDATFKFPKIKLNAESHAIYGEYKVNQGLSDAFFDEK